MSRRRKRPRREDEAFVNLLERVKTVFNSRSFAISGETWHCGLCVYKPLNTSEAGTSHARGTVSAGYRTPMPGAKLHPNGLALPRGDCLRGRTDGASWEKRLPQVPPDPEA